MQRIWSQLIRVSFLACIEAVRGGSASRWGNYVMGGVLWGGGRVMECFHVL